ncbi:sensor domain-containing protein [Mycobacterium simiae]|uniref:Sensor domain-containing protein n=1 Tax=Mycobacterium simiae TaxID=1784 RepID=A0A5B1BJM0_MYCSI|nr:sensor domain-containing protein [Mycobacterium simiae]KAA1248576.1 sensor domain-containing protein [Mycobacterium simiae]
MTSINGINKAQRRWPRRCRTTTPCVGSAVHCGALVSAVLIVLLAATGCTDLVAGTVRPAPELKPHPLTGQTVKHVLSADTDLSTMFGQSFEADQFGPPEFGGPEILFPGSLLGGEQQCAGVAHMLVQDLYKGSSVQQVATHGWRNTSPYNQDPVVIAVDEGVVALPTAPAADAVFAKFLEQGRHCVGASVTSATGFFTDEISDVRAIDSILVATVWHRHDGMSMFGERAIGVRVNCLIEVSVTFFRNPEPETSARHSKRVIDVARLMMDKISVLSR